MGTSVVICLEVMAMMKYIRTKHGLILDTSRCLDSKAKEEQARQERWQYIFERVSIFLAIVFGALFIALIFSTI